MANPSGRKGHFGEASIRAYLKAHGFPSAYLLKRQGRLDKGDVGNIEGVCIEIKNVSRYDISSWMKETATEKRNAGARTAAMIMKPKGIGDTRTGEWWAILTVEDYVQLLRDAGYSEDSDG